MKRVACIFAVAVAFLVGCGGGGSSSVSDKNSSVVVNPDENITKPDVNITKPDVNITKPDENITKPDENITKPDENITKPLLKHHEYVSGVYDIIYGTDKAFLSIDETGLVTSYDLDEEKNCYIKNPSNINDELNGKSLVLDEDFGVFRLGSASWKYDALNKNISIIAWGDTIEAGASININGTRIATSKKRVESPTTKEMQGNICPYSIVIKPDVNATNPLLKHYEYVSGVYDIIYGTDKAFLSIDETGLVTSYDLDEEKNCYIKNPSNINDELNGKRLTIDETIGIFKLANASWIYDALSENIKIVAWGSSIATDNALAINGTRIATSKKRVESLTAEEMQNNLCR